MEKWEERDDDGGIVYDSVRLYATFEMIGNLFVPR